LRRRIGILFYGDRTWSAHLADGLNDRFPEKVRCHSLLAYSQQASAASLSAALLSHRVICRVGHAPDMSRKKDVLWDLIANRLPGKRSFLYWIGTDVLSLTRRAHDSSLSDSDLSAIKRCRNLAGSQPLSAELAELGINSTTVPFPPPGIEVPSNAPPLPSTLRAMTYIPESRFDFYGGPQILEAARRVRHFEFVVMGSSGKGIENVPENVRFLGRVDDVPALLRETTVVVRTTEHDSVGATIMEALLYGRHVITTNVVPHTTHVSFGDADGLTEAMKAIEARAHSGELGVNATGREYAIEEFDTNRRFDRLLHVLID